LIKITKYEIATLVQSFQNKLRSTWMFRHHDRRTPSSLGSRQSWRHTSRLNRATALCTDDTSRRRPSARCEWFPMCRRHTRFVKALCAVWHARVRMYRGRETRGERVEIEGKRRETERERDTRTQRRISGVPLLRSRYDVCCRVGFALISDTSGYHVVCLTQIDPVEWLLNIASMNLPSVNQHYYT